MKNFINRVQPLPRRERQLNAYPRLVRFFPALSIRAVIPTAGPDSKSP